MLRLNYRVGSQIVTKMFDSIIEAYNFATKEIATVDDREYYKECCGGAFESITKTDLMLCVMRNVIENIVLISFE